MSMTDSKLFNLAHLAMQNAYAPYSGCLVGAALVTEDGSVYTARMNPSRNSDGALLEMMIKNQMRQISKQMGGDLVASEG